METKSSAKEMEFKVFNDSVHGHMEMHPLCVKIIDTPEFQRLRNIKQVGLTYLVYPGAAHNRFEHSLGVCYLAGEMIEALKKNQPDLNINEVDKLCVQIAGLCHDIGHGPFSHLWENFLKQKGLKWHEKISRGSWSRHFRGLHLESVGFEVEALVGPRAVHCGDFDGSMHEDQSVVMFNHLLEKNDLIGEFEKYGLHERERRFITELILGKGDSCDQGKKFLFQIVCNQTNSIDVDKWDYLMRDGLHLNLKVSFDYQRVLKFCRVIEKEECGKKMLHIGFRNKEAYNLYEMFVVRATLHYRAYQHRVVLLLTQMVVDAFLAADDHFTFKLDGNIVYKLSQAHEKPEIWTNLTDNIFYEILGSYTNELATAKDILNLILRRKLYKFIASINVVPSEYFTLQNKFWMDSVQKKLENKLNSETSCGNNSNRYLILFSSFYLGSNCPEPFRHVYFYDKDNRDRGVEKDWKDIALFPICQETAHHVEFYLFDKEQNGTVAEEAEAKSVFEKYMGSIMNGGVYNGS